MELKRIHNVEDLAQLMTRTLQQFMEETKTASSFPAAHSDHLGTLAVNLMILELNAERAVKAVHAARAAIAKAQT